MDHLCYFCLVFVMLSHAYVFDVLWSPAGKGLTSWLICDVLLCVCHFPMWYPGLGVVFDCINS